RYAASGVVYSLSKNVPGMDLKWCVQPDVGLPAPDLVIYLSAPIKSLASRGGFGNERYENIEMLSQVSKNYEILRDETWKTVDASLSIEEVFNSVQNLASECKKQVSGNPISKLWVEGIQVENPNSFTSNSNTNTK